jgi:F-type H+-transporting ATPase subunit b
VTGVQTCALPICFVASLRQSVCEIAMQISWWTLALQAVNFVVLVWLLSRFLYRPAQDVIEKRKRLSEQALTAAKTAQSDADMQKRRYEEAQAGIEAERKALLAEAQKAIEAERAQILDKTRLEAAGQVAMAKESLAKERADAVAGVQTEVAGLAVDLARKLLAELSRSIPAETILARLEAELAKLPLAERQRLNQELEVNGGKISVATAHKLLPDEEQVWRTRLSSGLGHPAKISFEQDPALLMGAVLRLPHMAVRVTWADQLEDAGRSLLKGHRGTAA